MRQIESQAPHRRRRIELLGHGNEGGTPLIEVFDDLGAGEVFGVALNRIDANLALSLRAVAEHQPDTDELDRRAVPGITDPVPAVIGPYPIARKSGSTWQAKRRQEPPATAYTQTSRIFPRLRRYR